MSLDDYYARQGSQQDKADRLEVKQYNRWVDIILEATRNMVHAAHNSPPASCDWVYEHGERRASWRLYSEIEGSYHISLMTDGRLVYVDASTSQVQSTIHLRHISQRAQQQEVGVGWAALSTLCTQVVTSALPMFGLSSPDHYHNDLLAHWRRTHPEDR